MNFFISLFLVSASLVTLILCGSAVGRATALSDGVQKAQSDEPKSETEDENVTFVSADEKTDKTVDDMMISVYNSKAEAYMEIPAKEYLYGVLLAEMPQSFADEALKAQAVAARTMLMYNISNGNPGDHKNAAVCTSSSHCMAYISPEDYAAASDDADFLIRVKDAVDSTAGKVCTKDGKPIMAAFHSCSYGCTESAENVWGAEYSYLVSVKTPENLYPDKVKKLYSSKTVDREEFIKAVVSAYPNASVSVSSVKRGIAVERDGADRVKSVTVGDTTISGKKMRSILSLKSTDFEIEQNDDKIVISVRGSGHGVGMSQYGAEIYASEYGYDYTKILGLYYSGTSIETFESFA